MTEAELHAWAADAQETLGEPFRMRAGVERPTVLVVSEAAVRGKEYEMTCVLTDVPRAQWAWALEQFLDHCADERTRLFPPPGGWCDKHGRPFRARTCEACEVDP